MENNHIPKQLYFSDPESAASDRNRWRSITREMIKAFKDCQWQSITGICKVPHESREGSWEIFCTICGQLYVLSSRLCSHMQVHRSLNNYAETIFNHSHLWVRDNHHFYVLFKASCVYIRCWFIPSTVRGSLKKDVLYPSCKHKCIIWPFGDYWHVWGNVGTTGVRGLSMLQGLSVPETISKSGDHQYGGPLVCLRAVFAGWPLACLGTICISWGCSVPHKGVCVWPEAGK